MFRDNFQLLNGLNINLIVVQKKESQKYAIIEKTKKKRINFVNVQKINTNFLFIYVNIYRTFFASCFCIAVSQLNSRKNRTPFRGTDFAPILIYRHPCR